MISPMSHPFVEHLGGHAELLPPESAWLPANLVGAGIAVDEGELIAWCAPKVGRIEIVLLSGQLEPDRAELSQWLALQGFQPDHAEAAATDLLSRINAPG
jgi:hypothetical protein